MCDAPKDGTPIIVYMGTQLPYVAFVYWDHTLNDGKGAWIYCSEMYSDRPNYITTYPSAWSHILWPTMDELNAISETNVKDVATQPAEKAVSKNEQGAG
jgi:hypothetical protein